MNYSDYRNNTQSRDKVIDTLIVYIKASDHILYKPLQSLSNIELERLVELFHTSIIKAINDSIKKEETFRMYKFAKLTIKEGNKIAYKIKDEVAREMGYKSYLDVPKRVRVEVRNESSKRIRDKKIKLKKNQELNKSSIKITLDIENIKKSIK